MVDDPEPSEEGGASVFEQFLQTHKKVAELSLPSRDELYER